MARFNARAVRRELAASRVGDYAAPAAHTAATVTYPAVVGKSHVITEGIVWSYSGTGTLSGGNLIVSVGGVTVFSVDITAKGSGVFPFVGAARVNEAMVITLADGGVDVSGKVTVVGHTLLLGAPLGVEGVFDFGDYTQSGLIATI